MVANNVTAGFVVPSFAIATSAGGAIIPRVRVITSATSGWNNVQLSINLWTVAPTYTNGDNGAYAPTGAANWLANYIVALTQFNDGAVGGGGLTGSSELSIKLGSGTTVYTDIQILTAATPASGQTFNIIPELLN